MNATTPFPGNGDIASFVRATVRKSLETAGLPLDYAPFLKDETEQTAPLPKTGGDIAAFVRATIRNSLETAGLPLDYAPFLKDGSGEAVPPMWSGAAFAPPILPDLVRKQSPLASPIPEGARFETRQFSNAAGTRPYKLYVPSSYHGEAMPLIVMLHGCTQNPDDFALGSGMNVLAEQEGFLVAYPAQTSAANPSRCWNWFNAADQKRDTGEPSLIAGITREIMQDLAVDPARVYIAGMSAGGAAAAVMGAQYPDLYAAIGVHSGLPCGAASDLPSALIAMRQGSGLATASNEITGDLALPRLVPTIVFHGDRDHTVSPRNGEAIIAGTARGHALSVRHEQGAAPSGRKYQRSLHLNADGAPVLEHWTVEGGGHTWFGGNSAGSFTDPVGPHASGEMLRFFLAHPLTAT